MKTIKTLCLLLVFTAATFYSCSDSDPIENNPVVAQKSVAMRTALNEMKKANDIGGKPAKASGRTATNPFCFEFVYPITFAFNNGTLVTVANFQGLVEVLTNESPTFYLEGMVFPFQITQGGAVHTITNDSDLNAVLENCGFNTLAQDLQYTYCFDLVFPIAVGAGDQVYETVNLAELIDQLSVGNQIIYPISVNYQGQVVAINSLYELYDMINNCDTCICTLEYAPVCVQTPNNGIQEFGNMCFAECAGYTQNDLVPCNPTNTCSISNVTTTVGDCVSNGTNYQVTLDFDYANVGNATYFEVYIDGVMLGTFPLSPVPTQMIVPYSPNVSASLTIQIPGTNCIGYGQWATPNCVVVPSNFGTQLGSCFHIFYPINVQYQGQLVAVHSDGELLQYYFPATAPMPAINYPIEAQFSNSLFQIQTQADFEALIVAYCN